MTSTEIKSKRRVKSKKSLSSDTHFCQLPPHHHHHSDSQHGQHPNHHHHHQLDEHGRSSRETLLRRSWKASNIDNSSRGPSRASKHVCKVLHAGGGGKKAEARASIEEEELENVKRQLLDNIDTGTIQLDSEKRQSITIKKPNGDEIPMSVSWEDDPISTGKLKRCSMVFRHMIEPRLKIMEAQTSSQAIEEERAGLAVGLVPFFSNLIDGIPGKLATVTTATLGIFSWLFIRPADERGSSRGDR